MDLNLSVSTWNYQCSYGEEANLEEAISEIRSDGFGIELWLGWKADPAAFERNRWEHLRDLTAGAASLSMHMSCRGFAALKDEIEVASHVGAGILVIHAASLDIIDPADTAKFDALRDVVVYGCERGVTLALENGCPWILRQAAERCGVSICVDVGHANIDIEPRRWTTTSFFDDFGARIGHVRLADNEGLRDSHMVPGDGNIDWCAVLGRLRAIEFSGHCVLELRTPAARASALRARECLLEIWDSADGVSWVTAPETTSPAVH